MKLFKSTPFLVACFVLAGCVTPISIATIKRAQQVAQSAAAVGVAADLALHKEHRDQVIAVQKAIDNQLITGRITSSQLTAIIVDKLPLDSKVAQYFDGALILWGITSTWWVAPNTDEAVMAVAQGFSIGISQGLASVPLLRAAADANSTPVLPPPAPSKANIKTF